MRVALALLTALGLILALAGCVQSGGEPPKVPPEAKYRLPIDVSPLDDYRYAELRPKRSTWFTWEDPGRYRSLETLKENYLAGVAHGRIISIDQSENSLVIQTAQGDKVAYYSAIRRANGTIIPAIYGVYHANKRRQTTPVKDTLDWMTATLDKTMSAPIRCRPRNILESGTTVINMLLPVCRR